MGHQWSWQPEGLGEMEAQRKECRPRPRLLCRPVGAGDRLVPLQRAASPPGRDKMRGRKSAAGSRERRGEAGITGFSGVAGTGRGAVSGCPGRPSAFLLGSASWHPPAGLHLGQGLREGSGDHSEPRFQRKHLKSGRAPGTRGFSERRGGEGTGQRQRLAEPPADPHPGIRPSIHPLNTQQVPLCARHW